MYITFMNYALALLSESFSIIPDVFLVMHSRVQLQHKILYSSHPIQSLKTQTTAPYAHISSDESFSLVPNVSEMFTFQ